MAARYTYFVLLGKKILSLLAIGIVFFIIWIASNNNANNGGRLVFSNTQKSEDSESIMKKPRYQGVDVHNRPYTISAESGFQKDKDTVALETLTADMTGDNNAWMAVNAGYGILNMTTRHMELSKGVELFYEGGYQFRTDHAQVDINKGNVYGDSYIEGQGGAGTIKANSFSVLERGNIIKFNGSVRMLLYQ